MNKNNKFSFNGFFDNLMVKAPDKCFENVFDSALSEFQKNGVFFLEDEFINLVNSFGNCLSNCIEQVLLAAKAVRNNENLSLYALFVYRAMMQRKMFLEHLQEFEFPEADTLEVRFLPFLILLPAIPELYERLKAQKLPEDVINATLRQFEDCVYLYEERTGKLGLSKRYFNHMQSYIDERELNIERLRFEVSQLERPILALRNSHDEIVILFDGVDINEAGMVYGTPPVEESESVFRAEVTETETCFCGYRALADGRCDCKLTSYAKSEWKVLLKKGDPVMSIHIPSRGALTREACEKSYERACEIFETCYPEFKYKAFHCFSWMLDPQLRAFLPENSNIVNFQKKYTLYAGKNQGDAVFDFVFKLKFKEYKDMPEDTSLQRAIKKHYLDGKYIYSYGGLFLVEKSRHEMEKVQA